MLRDKIRALSAEILSDTINIRRHLHQHPELSFQEQATSTYIKARLDGIGIPWQSIAGTGVIAII